MPCPDLFWLKFMDLFGQALGFSLGIVPGALVVFGGIYHLIRWHDRRAAEVRELRDTVSSRLDTLERRSEEQIRRQAAEEVRRRLN
jgi:hypothetical protein